MAVKVPRVPKTNYTKPRMSDADYSAQFGPTKAESDSAAARAKANAAASAPKDSTRKSVTVQGVQNPLQSAFRNAQPANKTSPVEDVAGKIARSAKAAVDSAGAAVRRVLPKRKDTSKPQRSPSTVHQR